MFQRWSQAIHAHPMTYRATEEGFELGLPVKNVVVEGGGRKVEVQYPHVAAVVVSPVAFKPRDARLSKFSDWLAEISMAAATRRVAQGHRCCTAAPSATTSAARATCASASLPGPGSSPTRRTDRTTGASPRSPSAAIRTRYSRPPAPPGTGPSRRSSCCACRRRPAISRSRACRTIARPRSATSSPSPTRSRPTRASSGHTTRRPAR